jgi:hypothetical protein
LIASLRRPVGAIDTGGGLMEAIALVGLLVILAAVIASMIR